MEPMSWKRINKIQKLIKQLNRLEETLNYLDFIYSHQELSLAQCLEHSKAVEHQRRLVEKLRKQCAKFLEEASGI